MTIEELVRAYCEDVEAVAGRGHEGEPHDHRLAAGKPDDSHPPKDCLACAGAQYGTGANLSDAMQRAYNAAGMAPEGLPQWFLIQAGQLSRLDREPTEVSDAAAH